MKSSCARCGACCVVFAVAITPFDILRIAEGTGRKPSEFVAALPLPPQKARKGASVLINGKMLKLALKWSAGRVCTFYSKEGCVIYDSRPMACRVHPFDLKNRELASAELRMCEERWTPRNKAAWARDFERQALEAGEYRKIAEEWNSRGGGSLNEFLAFAMGKAKAVSPG